jgi:hypothetical protein
MQKLILRMSQIYAEDCFKIILGKIGSVVDLPSKECLKFSSDSLLNLAIFSVLSESGIPRLEMPEIKI